jgi:anti-anti-sigma regulatory factor
MYEITIDPSKMNGMIALKDSVTIQNAIELKESFKNAFDEVNTLYVTHESLTECDTSYLQILIAANKSAVELKKSFKVIGQHPEVFKNLINSSGCTSFSWMEEGLLTNSNKEVGNE